jgi:DNA ligase
MESAPITVEKLAERLKTQYEESPKNEQVVNIHLFGIKYGEIIKKYNYSASKIIELADLNKSYKTELSKGIKLSKFVKLKNEHND